MYHSTETSVLKDDEIKGKKFNPYSVNISEYTMKNSEVVQWYYRKDNKADDQDDSSLESDKTINEDGDDIEPLNIPDVLTAE